MKKLKDIFNCKRGEGIDLIYLNQKPNGSDYISRSEKQEGVIAKVNAENPNPPGSLTVALGGSILSTFVRSRPFITSQNVEILTPKQQLTLQEKIWYATTIKANRYKFNYGRHANKELKHLLLPDPPAWVNDIEIPDYSHLKESKIQEQVELKDWKSFDIHQLFQISRHKGPSIEWVSENPGPVPFVSATKFNNGVSGHCIETNEYEKVKGGCLTIQANGTDIGTCFFQKNDFYVTGDVVIATPKTNISKECLIYCAALVSKNIYKFNYGRKFNGVRTHITISLPTIKGEPDWDGITKFIQSCKFSSTI